MQTKLFNHTTLAMLLCTTVMFCLPVQAQVMDAVPHLIDFQGRLTDSLGVPAPNGQYAIAFAIWSDSTSTAPTDREWISPNCTVLVVNGLFNWQLGSKEGLPPWTMTNDADLWLGVEVAGEPELVPRTRLCSSPYAYKAWQAEYAGYSDSSGSISPPLLLSGSSTGPIIEGVNSGSGHGVRGEASSPGGRGVAGEAVDTGPGSSYGGHFVAASQEGIGVFGEASNTGDVLNYGGSFYAAGEQGIAVSGRANSDFGENYGGFFVARGDQGRGVHGEASSQTGPNYGGYFRSRGAPGYGVYGWADNVAGGVSYGGYFVTDANAGRGVYGRATSTSPGNTYGGYFVSASQAGVGVYGEASDSDVYMNYGGQFTAAGEEGRGVSGNATNGNGENYGGFFSAAGDQGRAVYGHAGNASGQNFGGYFRASGSSGTGVFGYASHASGTNYGIHGKSNSPSGYAGYFEGNVATTDTVEMTGFKLPAGAVSGRVLTSDANGNGTWQSAVSSGGEAGEFDGEVNSDMVEDAGVTTINFTSAFTTTQKPHMLITVVLKQSANGLAEGAAIRAVEDIKGAAENWTGFDITVSKYSDGSSISDLTQVFVAWMAIGR